MVDTTASDALGWRQRSSPTDYGQCQQQMASEITVSHVLPSHRDRPANARALLLAQTQARAPHIRPANARAAYRSCPANARALRIAQRTQGHPYSPSECEGSSNRPANARAAYRRCPANARALPIAQRMQGLRTRSCPANARTSCCPADARARSGCKPSECKGCVPELPSECKGPPNCAQSTICTHRLSWRAPRSATRHRRKDDDRQHDRPTTDRRRGGGGGRNLPLLPGSPPAVNARTRGSHDAMRLRGGVRMRLKFSHLTNLRFRGGENCTSQPLATRAPARTLGRHDLRGWQGPLWDTPGKPNEPRRVRQAARSEMLLFRNCAAPLHAGAFLLAS